MSDPLPADLAAVFADIDAWRAFLDPYAPHNLGRPLATAAPGDLPSLLRASLTAPFGAPAGVAAGLWAQPAPLAVRTALALWLVALPEHGLTAAHAARALDHAIVLCREAPELPFDLFVAFADQLRLALFRASYAAVDLLPAASAAGDFVAAGAQRFFPAHRAPPPARPTAPRARIGYVSRHFRRHAVGQCVANRIVCRDRARFEVTTFMLGFERDDVTRLIERHSDEHVAVSAEDVGAAARAIAARRLDLLLFADAGMDLPSYVLAGLRLAPRQAVLMGHAATTGLPTLSHYIGGDHEAPGADAHYRERLVRLPRLGAAQLPPVEPARPPTRGELGLPDDAVVLVSTAHGIKHPPERDALLVDILRSAPAAHIALKPYFAADRVDRRFGDRLGGAARAAGVADRLHILPPLARAADVLGLLAVSDVLLDTYPFGGWTTSLEALWAGLPIVTQEGVLGRSRWGAALLRALAIDDGIAADERGYVAEAVRFAADAALRTRVRARIAAGARAAFFDGPAAQPAYEAALLDLLAR